MKVTLSALLLCLCSLLCWGAAVPERTAVSLEAEVLEAANRARSDSGLPALVPSESLARAAREHSLDMMAHNYFSHSAPDPEHQTIKQRLRLSGCYSLSFGENLYRCQGYPARQLAEVTVRNWLNSPAHRANLLSPKFNRMGVGIAQSGRDGFVVTQDMCLEAVDVRVTAIREDQGRLDALLDCRVSSGAAAGVLFFRGRKLQPWRAAGDGVFQLDLKLPGPGLLELGQEAGPGDWRIETEVELKARP